jgi:hypothetical protein
MRSHAVGIKRKGEGSILGSQGNTAKRGAFQIAQLTYYQQDNETSSSVLTGYPRP